MNLIVLFLSLLQAAPVEPANPAADLNRARLYLERDRFAQALPLLERVVRAPPGVVEPAYLQAVCYSALGRPAQEYSTVHHFPRLQFVLFSLVTTAVGVEIALERLSSWRAGPGTATVLRVAVTALPAVRLSAAERHYRTDPHIQQRGRA